MATHLFTARNHQEEMSEMHKRIQKLGCAKRRRFSTMEEVPGATMDGQQSPVRDFIFRRFSERQ